MIAETVALRTQDQLLVEPFKGMSWSSILGYFQQRETPSVGSLPKGTAKQVSQARHILDNIFTFNNETYCLGLTIDWKSNPSQDLEWLILLHKFYYCKDLSRAYDFTRNEIYAQKWLGLIDSWMTQVGQEWIDNQVAGRRIQQWILSYHYFVSKWRSPSITPEFFECFMHSLTVQTHHLCEHLTAEGNHRTLELYAIFLVAVTFPELRSAAYFLDFSKQKLIENIQMDLLPDGVHRELSTDYHHTVLKNYLRFRELATANQIALPTACDDLLKRAIEFSYFVHKPDGYIPAINDGDCNSYLPLLLKASASYPESALEYVLSQGSAGLPPTSRSKGFPDSGYYMLRSDWQTLPFTEAHYLFFDCAGLGFGSHGHYDALNIEVAAFGQSLIVDPGRYTYSEEKEEGINWRHYFKGTSAHNTVVVDGLDQIPYHCEKPIDPEPKNKLITFISTQGFDFLHGQVSSQQYPVTHERMIFFMHPEYWIITDRLTAQKEHHYDLYFHLSARAQDQTKVMTHDAFSLVQSPNLLIVQPADDSNPAIAIKQGYVSPEYGIKFNAPIVHFSRPKTGSTTFQTVLYPFKASTPTVQVKQLTVYQQTQPCDITQVSAILIQIKTESTIYRDYFFICHTNAVFAYQFDDVSCACRLLYIRTNEAKQIINLQADGIHSINYFGADLITGMKGDGRVCYQDQSLTLTDVKENRELVWAELPYFPKWVDLVSRWVTQ